MRRSSISVCSVSVVVISVIITSVVVAFVALGAPVNAQAPPAPDIIISEIMYNPPDQGGTEGALLEFIELYNRGAASASLRGVHFTDGIDFTFEADTPLAPGEHLILAASAIHFAGRYGFTPAGEYGGQLNNGGERVTLSSAAGTQITAVDYSDSEPWPTAADGCGYSLVFAPAHPADSQNNALAWERSSQLNGSPGTADAPLVAAPVRINEALTHTDLPQQDAIELLNPTNEPVDIGGWFLTDDATDVRRFRIPDCTWVEAGGLRVFTEEQFGFALSALSEEVYIVAAGSHGEQLGYSHGFTFGVTPNGVSLGRHVISTGEEHFPLQITTTLGAPNAGPRVGPVVISQIMYNPAPNNGTAGDEYIELTNISAASAPLHDPAHPENVWRLDGIDAYNFPADTTIPPGGTLLVVPLDPDSYRARHNIPATVQIVGPYAGRLSDDGERLALMRPDVPNTDGTVPYFAADALTYESAAPWPATANGTGHPLVRVRTDQYADDPINWRAGWALYLPVIR